MANQRSEKLQARFGLTGELAFESGPDGLLEMQVTRPEATARIALQGAQVLDWTPSGEAPVIWCSPEARYARGQAVRGGIPICWPWFGPHADDPALPAHGLARTREWRVEATASTYEGTQIDLSLVLDEDAQRQWPHPATLSLRLQIGRWLTLALTTRNDDTRPLRLGEALHTYFHVGDIERVSLLGLEGLPYIDKVAGGERGLQGAALSFTGETDRIYLSEGECQLLDPMLARNIIIEKRGSGATVVWNPWLEKSHAMGDMADDGYREMLCVESANAAEAEVTLAPGETHTLWARYGVEPLSG